MGIYNGKYNGDTMRYNGKYNGKYNEIQWEIQWDTMGIYNVDDGVKYGLYGIYFCDRFPVILLISRLGIIQYRWYNSM